MHLWLTRVDQYASNAGRSGPVVVVAFSSVMAAVTVTISVWFTVLIVHIYVIIIIIIIKMYIVQK